MRAKITAPVQNQQQNQSMPTLAYQIHPGDGPFMALLHGFLSSAAQWQDNLQALATVCRPVTIELWGHGNSPVPEDDHSYQPAGYVAALEALREALGAEQWLLCGYSISAGLTTRYAHTYPQRTLAHILTNSISGFADLAQQREWQANEELSASNIESGGLAAIERMPIHPKRARNLPQHVTKALIEDAQRLSPFGVAQALRHTIPNVSVRDIAADNPRPALLCHGIHEHRFASYVDWAAANMARLQVVELDAGHGVNMQDAPGFNQAVIQFVHQACRA